MKAVLITGASAGIGEQFARRLAAEGHHLVLAARRLEYLERMGEELSASFNVQVISLRCDLTEPDAPEKLAAALQERDIRITGLVNNAGFGDRGAFTDLSLERQMNMIQLNVTALVALSWRLVPQLKEANDGFLVNVASLAAFQAGPNMAIYYATKAFVLSFTEALHEELASQVAVSALCPGATESEFAQEAHIADTLLFALGTMKAEDVVRTSLNQRRRAIVIPGWKNKLAAWATKLAPRLLSRRISARLQA